MPTECTQNSFVLHWENRREVVARFDGGVSTSDGGGVLLREVEKRARIARQFAAYFTDHRNPALIEHTVEELVAQRVYALALVRIPDQRDHQFRSKSITDSGGSRTEGRSSATHSSCNDPPRICGSEGAASVDRTALLNRVFDRGR